MCRWGTWGRCSQARSGPRWRKRLFPCLRTPAKISRGTSHLKSDSVRGENSLGDARLTGIGEVIEERSAIHAIGSLHPRGLNRGSQQRIILIGRNSALTGDQGSK